MDSTALRQLLGGRRLSPAQRRIARYLLEHPQEAAYLGAVDLAERVGVSQASVTRFAFALGFETFPEFRAAVRSLVLTPTTNGPAEELNEIQLLVETEIRNLRSLRDGLADLGPREMRDALTFARRVGLRTVLVTDQPINPPTEHADLVLTAPVSSHFACNSHAASTALCSALLLAMLAALPKERQAGLDAFEATAAQREVFVAD